MACLIDGESWPLAFEEGRIHTFNLTEGKPIGREPPPDQLCDHISEWARDHGFEHERVTWQQAKADDSWLALT